MDKESHISPLIIYYESVVDLIVVVALECHKNVAAITFSFIKLLVHPPALNLVPSCLSFATNPDCNLVGYIVVKLIVGPVSRQWLFVMYLTSIYRMGFLVLFLLLNRFAQGLCPAVVFWWDVGLKVIHIHYTLSYDTTRRAIIMPVEKCRIMASNSVEMRRRDKQLMEESSLI